MTMARLIAKWRETSEAATDSVSRLSKRWWGQLLIVAAFVAPDFVWLMASGRMIAAGDVTNYLQANAYFLQEALRHGHSILWDPSTFSGFPSFVSDGEFFSISNLTLTRYFGFIISYHVLLFAFLVLIGFFTARVIIELGGSSRAAIIGGLSFVISTQTITMSLLRGYLFLPALCLIALLIAKRRYPLRYLVPIGGFVAGSALLSTHFNLLIIALTGASVFSIFFWRLFGGGDPHATRGTFGAYACVAAIGLAIGLLRFLPLLSFIKFTSQSGGMLYSAATEGAIAPADFLSFIFPKFDIPLLSSSPVLYLGILPLVFLSFSFVLKGRLPRFLMAVFAVCLLLSVKWSPLFWLLQKMPVFRYFRVPSRWMLLGSFAACLLIGLGADAYLTEGHQKFKATVRTVFKWMFVALLAIGTVTTAFVVFLGAATIRWLKAYFDAHLYAKTAGLPLQHYHQVIDQYFQRTTAIFDFSNVAFLVSSLLIGLSYALIRRSSDAQGGDKRFLPAAILLVGLNYSMIHPFFYETVNKDFFSFRPPIAAYIAEHPGRTLAFLPGFTEFTELDAAKPADAEARFRFESEILSPKFNEFYGIDSADGYDSMMPATYSKIMAMVGSDRVVTGDSIAAQKSSIEDKIAVFSRNRALLDMLGVRYVVSTYDLSGADLAPVTSATDVSSGVAVHLFENEHALPLVYLAKDVIFTEVGAKIDFGRLSGTDFHRDTFIECGTCKVQSGAGSLKVEAQENGRLQAHVASARGTWLVYDESDLPGWRASIDGRPAEIHRANEVFQSVFVPPGDHEVEFRFSYFATLPRK